MRGRRPNPHSVYLEKECTGYFGFEPIVRWIARDAWGHEITRAKTKRECQAEARKCGYTPR